MSRAAEYLIDALRTQYAVDGLSLHTADSLLHEPHPSLWMPGGQQVDLEPLVQEALDRAARAVSSFVERKWGEGRTFAYLLFTGGGAFSLRDRLEQRYPHGIFLPNAVTSNAIGLARYAQRLWG